MSGATATIRELQGEILRLRTERDEAYRLVDERGQNVADAIAAGIRAEQERDEARAALREIHRFVGLLEREGGHINDVSTVRDMASRALGEQP